MEETEFRPGSVPVCVAARVYGTLRQQGCGNKRRE